MSYPSIHKQPTREGVVEVKNIKKTSVVALSLLFLALLPSVCGQIQPQVSNASVEEIKFEQEFLELDIYEPCSHFTYTFALNKVNEWAERVYFTTWLDAFLVANWSIGFSANDPPGLQGVYLDESTGILAIWVVMAEFPYEEKDGTYYYRIHFFFEDSVFKGGEARVAANYLVAPTFMGSELTVVRVKNSKTVDGTEVFKFKTVKQK